MELLGNYDVPLFDLDKEELEKDIRNARRYHQ